MSHPIEGVWKLKHYARRFLDTGEVRGDRLGVAALVLEVEFERYHARHLDGDEAEVQGAVQAVEHLHEHADVAQVHVHVPEEVLLHVVTIGVRVAGGQADVFVEVERGDL